MDYETAYMIERCEHPPAYVDGYARVLLNDAAKHIRHLCSEVEKREAELSQVARRRRERPGETVALGNPCID